MYHIHACIVCSKGRLSDAIFTDTCATHSLYNSFFLTKGHPITQIGIIVAVTRGSEEKTTENEKWVKTQKVKQRHKNAILRERERERD